MNLERLSIADLYAAYKYAEEQSASYANAAVDQTEENEIVFNKLSNMYYDMIEILEDELSHRLEKL